MLGNKEDAEEKGSEGRDERDTGKDADAKVITAQGKEIK